MRRHGALEPLLEAEIERRPHGAAAGPHLGRERREHEVAEVRRAIRGRDEARRHALLADAGGLVRGEEAAGLEQAEDVIPARERAVEVADRIVEARRARQHREQRRLARAEPLRRLAEVGARRGLDAVRAAPEVGAVQVLLEDLALAERALDPEREDRLRDLVAQRARRARRVDHPHELHRDRRAAVGEAAGREIEPEGARDPDRVDARVLEEAAILGREQREDRVRAHVAQADPRVAAGARDGARHATEQLAVPVLEDERRARVRRQALRRVREAHHRRGDRQDREGREGQGGEREAQGERARPAAHGRTSSA